MSHAQTYPDVSDIWERKAKGRTARAALGFAEKLAILEEMKRASTTFALSSLVLRFGSENA